MTGRELLKKKITDSGMTFKAISEKAEMSRQTLYNKLNNNVEFTASEIVGLTNSLNLSNEEREKIFFAKQVELKETKP